jgi:hypothetical protein
MSCRNVLGATMVLSVLSATTSPDAGPIGMSGATAQTPNATTQREVEEPRLPRPRRIRPRFEPWWHWEPGMTYPGTIYPGTIYPGRIYPGRMYPGTPIYPGAIYPGEIYPGWMYPGMIY